VVLKPTAGQVGLPGHQAATAIDKPHHTFQLETSNIIPSMPMQHIGYQHSNPASVHTAALQAMPSCGPLSHCGPPLSWRHAVQQWRKAIRNPQQPTSYRHKRQHRYTKHRLGGVAQLAADSAGWVHRQYSCCTCMSVQLPGPRHSSASCIVQYMAALDAHALAGQHSTRQGHTSFFFISHFFCLISQAEHHLLAACVCCNGQTAVDVPV
jgi:hypothetical protein